jgi:hypothetical protein
MNILANHVQKRITWPTQAATPAAFRGFAFTSTV